MPRLKDSYQKEMIPALMQKFQYKNIMQVPKLEKVVINMGMGDIKDNPKLLDSAVNELTIISGDSDDLRTETCSYSSQKIRRELQSS